MCVASCSGQAIFLVDEDCGDGTATITLPYEFVPLPEAGTKGIALEEPDNYEARSNLMWASTIALNHLLTVGKGGAWSVHPMEHELSAFYDITHGVGLAILTPAWMKYVLCDKTVDRFALFARNVWGIEAEDAYEAARLGIEKTEEFFKNLGMPQRLSEVGIGTEKLQFMAEETVRTSRISSHSYYPLQAEDILKIFESVC